MPSLDTPRSRWTAIALCLFALVTLCMLMGVVSPAPEQHYYPDDQDLAADYDSHAGQYATVSGTVVATDPVVIETGDGIELTIQNAERLVTDSHQLRAFGVVQPDHTIAADATLTREPWETTYMYVVSALAGLWVLTRLIRGWYFSTAEWAFVPRHDSSTPSTAQNTTPSREEQNA